MSARALLRACLIGLVLVGLVFVQLTGAAGLGWLLPLYALTVLAPLLARLRERAVYRGLWNLSVLAVFGVLVHHASGNDMRYVLEDGLVLAALCQVHLLNNLREEQRPDLLFLNSFLIAIVTGYLSQDLAFAIAFLLYAPLFVLALQLRCLTQAAGDLSPHLALHIARDGLARSALLLAATLAVFLLWPRDFQRQGFLVGRFDFASRAGSSEIGFDDRLELERVRRARASDRVVMSVELREGSPADVPALWRGATLGATNGREWWPIEVGDLAAVAADADPWRREGTQLVRGDDSGVGLPRVRVTLSDARADRLFAPLGARHFAASSDDLAERVVPGPDGTLQLDAVGAVGERASYELTLGPQGPAENGERVAPPPPGSLAPFTVIPDTERLRAARELATTLAARLPEGTEQHELVAAFSDHLRTRYRYLAPGEDGGPGSLEEFLEGDAGGHCEFFASALATMLRSRGVPCRIVTGYRSHEWDAAGVRLTFRGRDAHAWVEVFDPRSGWISADPTPPASVDGEEGTWRDLRAALGAAWARLTGFNAERRGEVLVWLRALPARLVRVLERHPLQAGLLLLLGVLGVALARLRRRLATPAGVRHYREALRRARLRLEPGETPRELLSRARSVGIPLERMEDLRRATDDHERSRYAA